LWLGLLWANGRQACWALFGSTCGLLLALLQDGPTSAALAGLHGYNPALAALALCRNGRARCAPLCGIALACLLHAGFIALALPTLTAPFILACWLVQTGQRLGQRGFRRVVLAAQKTVPTNHAAPVARRNPRGRARRLG
ncbi:MAG TPA: urea transporter, partial [Pseudomonas sp.]|nr:urea transporter [Pseudomonas sp.]